VNSDRIFKVLNHTKGHQSSVQNWQWKQAWPEQHWDSLLEGALRGLWHGYQWNWWSLHEVLRYQNWGWMGKMHPWYQPCFPNGWHQMPSTVKLIMSWHPHLIKIGSIIFYFIYVMYIPYIHTLQWRIHTFCNDKGAFFDW